MTARKLASNLDANGRKIINLPAATPASSEPVRQSDHETDITGAKSRANHTGTQIASTISDFDTQVRTNRLDQMTAPNTDVSLNSHKITNALDGSSAQDYATYGQLQAAIASLTSSQVLKGKVRVVHTTNITISNPGTAVFDGITMANGDIVLLTGQSTGSQKGPYTFNGSGVAMTRALNWDVAGEAVVGSYWIVAEGTQADTFALMTNDTFVLSTDTPVFVYITVAAAQVASVEQDLGDGSAVTFTVAHSFTTRAVSVVVYRNSSPWDEIEVAVLHDTTGQIKVQPDEVWSTNQFHCVVGKLRG